jgi:hypothetical protein
MLLIGLGARDCVLMSLSPVLFLSYFFLFCFFYFLFLLFFSSSSFCLFLFFFIFSFLAFSANNLMLWLQTYARYLKLWVISGCHGCSNGLLE